MIKKFQPKKNKIQFLISCDFKKYRYFKQSFKVTYKNMSKKKNILLNFLN